MLIDMIGLFRDVLLVQTGSSIALINEELRSQVEQMAAASSPEQTVRRLEALEHERTVLLAGGSPRTVVEAAMVLIKDPNVQVAHSS